MKSDAIWLLANWKMNGTANEARLYANAIAAALEQQPAMVECIFCPPNPYLALVAEHLPQNARLKLGAQNCHDKISGAFTGETSAGMLKDAGCAAVIVGHSERRAMGETDADVLAKAKAALAAGLLTVICVGESASDYASGDTNAALAVQLKPLIELPQAGYLVAYEPVWAIGSGKTPTLLEIEAAHAYIKSVLGSATPVLYGGSVNAGNAREILHVAGVSGALVGSASLTVSVMQEIINAARG